MTDLTFTLTEVVTIFVFMLSVIITPMAAYIWHRIAKDIKANAESARYAKHKAEELEKHIEKKVPTFEQASQMCKKRIRRAFTIHDHKHHADKEPTFPKPEEDL